MEARQIEAITRVSIGADLVLTAACQLKRWDEEGTVFESEEEFRAFHATYEALDAQAKLLLARLDGEEVPA